MATIQLKPTYGWLAPNGDFYPCALNKKETISLTNDHETSAQYLILEVLGIDPETIVDEYGMSAAQAFLIKKGWIRTDTNIILYEGKMVTAEQVNSLKRLLAMPSGDGFNKDYAQEIIDKFEGVVKPKLIPPQSRRK